MINLTDFLNIEKIVIYLLYLELEVVAKMQCNTNFILYHEVVLSKR